MPFFFIENAGELRFISNALFRLILFMQGEHDEFV